ncbi:MAG: D-glycero-beta-D-manno-heptose-7-phosphate kinase [candidate division Zixibacteria bacterium]|nr:D-glycero-beta-D-manno-heptose-7-phosphate kinase [candidate division Zixibacteria bacterium]
MPHEKFYNLSQVASRLGGHKILVIGDLMLDEYVWGQVNRISPESPVPVVEVQNQTAKLGGAANVALNLRALGDRPVLIGVTGKDSASTTLKRLLKKHGIATGSLVADRGRPTTVKTRIVAHGQQLVRADRESCQEVSDSITTKLSAIFKTNLNSARAVIISDYGKGVITTRLLREVIAMARRKGVFVAVDPKEAHFMNYREVSVITPNHHEAGFVSGKRITTEQSLQDVGWNLLDILQVDSILITRGEKGMALFERNRDFTLIPTVAKNVFDVTGAGDTVISSLVSAVCAGANLKEAAWISNHAAGRVIAELGTAQVSKKELQREIKNYPG